MRFDSLFRSLFVIYCIEAGLFLIISPWTESWEKIGLIVPFLSLRSLLTAPWVRGLFSGFGLVHLVWAAHDIDLLVRGHGGELADPTSSGRH